MSIDNKEIGRLEQEMNSFDADDRKEALNSLKHSSRHKDQKLENVNLHFHSFNSYNAENWSPSRIAWESKKRALYASGIIDFDVLAELVRHTLPVRLLVGGVADTLEPMKGPGLAFS